MDKARGVPLVRYGPYSAKGNVPEHCTYVELAVARAWNYRGDPDTIGYDLAEARLLEAVAEAGRKWGLSIDEANGFDLHEACDAFWDALNALAAHRALPDSGSKADS